MSDYMLVENAVSYPNACVCGNQSRPLVDTHIELVGGQRVYLCERCVRQAGQLLGMVEASRFARIDGELNLARARVTELETELTEAAPILSAVAAANRRYGGAV